jgi:glycerophosphoryl diester phosphodiesterase
VKIAGQVAALLLAIGFLVLTFTNASWIADAPKGNLRLIANRAIAQQYIPTGETPDCTAGQIEQPVHDYIENTGRSFAKARALGAQMVRVDVAFSADGKVVFLADQTLDCRTDGTGPVSGKTLAELRRLDIARGYSADGGNTHPLAGSPRQHMASLDEAHQVLRHIPILYNLAGDDPQTGERLVAALKASSRDVERVGDAFVGQARPVAAIRQAYPGAWAWTWEEAETCASDYTRTGWTGSVPESCKGGTMAIPIDRQWPFWGWPNRLSARMVEAGGRIVMTGPTGDGEEPRGLTLPEQLQDVPSTFRGHLLIDDFWTVGTALRPTMDRRTVSEQIEAEKGLERRRARQ